MSTARFHRSLNLTVRHGNHWSRFLNKFSKEESFLTMRLSAVGAGVKERGGHWLSIHHPLESSTVEIKDLIDA